MGKILTRFWPDSHLCGRPCLFTTGSGSVVVDITGSGNFVVDTTGSCVTVVYPISFIFFFSFYTRYFSNISRVLIRKDMLLIMMG